MPFVSEKNNDYIIKQLVLKIFLINFFHVFILKAESDK